MMVSLMCLMAYIGYCFGRASANQYHVERDTLTFVDTIPFYKPVPKDSTVISYVTRCLPAVKAQGTGTAVKTDTISAGFYAQNDGKNIPLQGLSDERDSMTVEIPITQKHYESEEYSAYVSGYEAQLDSIFVFPKTTVIRESISKPPNHWHLGITGGVGYGFRSNQVEPFIGIGITYSLISF